MNPASVDDAAIKRIGTEGATKRYACHPHFDERLSWRAIPLLKSTLKIYSRMSFHRPEPFKDLLEKIKCLMPVTTCSLATSKKAMTEGIPS